MAINVNVQYNGGLLADIIPLTQCYLHRGTRLNAMQEVLYLQPLIPPKCFDIFPPLTGVCSEGLGVLWFFFKKQLNRQVMHQKSIKCLLLPPAYEKNLFSACTQLCTDVPRYTITIP